MATISTSWTTGQSLRAAATLAAGAAATHALDIATAGYDLVNVQVDILIGTSTGVTVEVLPSVDGGTTVDLTAAYQYTVAADDRRSVQVPGHSHVTIKITNDDGANATGSIAVLYDGRQWATA